MTLSACLLVSSLLCSRRIIDQLEADVFRERPLSDKPYYAEQLQHLHTCKKSIRVFKVWFAFETYSIFLTVNNGVFFEIEFCRIYRICQIFLFKQYSKQLLLVVETEMLPLCQAETGTERIIKMPPSL